MPRRPKGPWKRKGRGWYCSIRGQKKPHWLAPGSATEEQARTAWHEFMSKARRQHVDASPPDEITAVEVADRYLVWVKRNRSEATYAVAERYLTPWVKSLEPGVLASDVRPFDATEWIDLTHEKPGARRMAYRVVKASWRWADLAGLIDRNPLRGISTPPQHKREISLTKQQYKLALAAASPQLRTLIHIARLTGMRAQEIRIIEARHLSAKEKAIEFPRDESKGKRRRRIVWLVDEAWKILAAAARKRKTGPILRNEDGAAWTKDAIVCAFRRVRERLKNRKVNGKPEPVEIPGLCLTAIRHTYATDAIEEGVDVLTLAELMGHKDAQMLNDHYAEVGRRAKHMRKAAKKAVGG